MSDEEPEPKSRHNRAWLNLVWAMPIASVCSYPIYWLSSLWWCGIYGCNPSADAVDKEPFISIAVLVVGGAVAALPLVVIPWTGNERRRSVVALSYWAISVVVIVAVRLLDPWYWR